MMCAALSLLATLLLTMCRCDTSCSQSSADTLQPHGVCLKTEVDGTASSYRLDCDADDFTSLSVFFNDPQCSGEALDDLEGGLCAPWDKDCFCNDVCSIAFAGASVITTVVGCTESAAGVVGACEAAGLGPGDPIADWCAVAFTAIFLSECEGFIAASGQFNRGQCGSACEHGFGSPETETDVNATLELACTTNSCGYFITTKYLNISDCDSLSTSIPNEIATATNICDNGLKYQCNDTHITAFSYSTEDCSGEPDSTTSVSNELDCDADLKAAKQFQCFEGEEEDNSFSQRASVSSSFVLVIFVLVSMM